MPVAPGGTRKVLGQLNPAATTLTAVYTVPASTTADITALVVCNQAGSAATFRMSVAVAGASDNAKQYLAYDKSLAANDWVNLLTDGVLTLGAGDVIRIYASSANLSVNVFGVEYA